MPDHKSGCKQAEEWMQKSLDGVLTPAERRALDVHVAGCETCAAAWEEHRRLARVATAWARRPSHSNEGADQFTAAVLSRIAIQRPAKPAPRPWALALIAACCLAMAAITAYFLLPPLASVSGETFPLLSRPGSAQSIWTWLAQSMRALPADTQTAWSVIQSPGLSYTPALAALGAAALCAVVLALQALSPRRRLTQ